MDIKSKQFAKSTTTNKSERIGIPPWLISDHASESKGEAFESFSSKRGVKIHH